MGEESMWDVAGVASFLGVAPKTAYVWAEVGVRKGGKRLRLPAYKMGGTLRFDPAAVRAWRENFSI